MSYAHTKRRKNIAKWKKNNPNNWLQSLIVKADEVTRKNDGPLLGTLEDIMNQPRDRYE